MTLRTLLLSVLGSTAFIATTAVPALSAPAGDPRCNGMKATIVGTEGGEIIEGLPAEMSSSVSAALTASSGWRATITSAGTVVRTCWSGTPAMTFSLAAWTAMSSWAMWAMWAMTF